MPSHITLRLLTKCFVFPAIILLQVFFANPSVAQGTASSGESPVKKIKKSRNNTASSLLQQSLQCFTPLSQDARYSLTLCADIPDNANSTRVHLKSETGHVFLIYSMFSGQDTVHNVFGFYPRRPASSLIFKNVRSEILSNSRREYNASVTLEMNAEIFSKAIQKAVELAHNKYNLNRYNCYDYALELFNAVSEKEPIPCHHIRFPFIFGKGGSPCVLYAQLQNLNRTGSVWAPSIKFGVFRAPVSANK